MSVYSISNKFLDTYDPFWTCRLLSLKVGTAAILLFLCNAFLLAPQSPITYLLTIAIGTLASEVIPAPTRSRKIVNFISIVFLLAISTIVFGMFSYFRFGLFFVVITFTYLVLRFMAASPKVAAVPTIMITWGVMSLGGGATDFNAVANNYLYFFEFGLMGVITILFFPDFTSKVFYSAFIRILESDITHIGDRHYKNSDPHVLTALYVMHSKLPFLPERYNTQYEALIQFQNDFMKPHGLTAEEQLLSRSVLSEFKESVSAGLPFSLATNNSQQIRDRNPTIYKMFSNLVSGYNPCKV